MRKRPGLRRIAAAAGALLALTAALLAAPSGAGASSGEALSVNLGSVTGPSTGVGEGFLYGVSQDATQPTDNFLLPLHINAFRGGGHASGGWIGDGYQNGAGTKADVDEIIAQAKRLTKPPYKAQYQVLLSDIFGADGGQPANTVWPCTSGDCSNWVTYLDDVVGELQASGLKFTYEIWNEPELSIFYGPGVNTTQYFQTWDTAYREIRRLAPAAPIAGPSLAFTPQRMPGEWQTWLSHVKAAGTVPDVITNHNEGDVDDPVTVSQTLNADLAAAGIPARPLSSNEYQPADRQTAGVTAWYLARFAQSGYSSAMRGNWVCCLTPNLAGVLTQTSSGWEPNGNWWAMRAYADMTGSLVSTSGEVATTAISAAKDPSHQRAVALVGDSNGYTGAATVTYSGLSSVPWLSHQGSVDVTVYRIPDQSPLTAPQVVSMDTVSTSGGTISVPLTFQSSHDAFAIYLTNPGASSSVLLSNQPALSAVPSTAVATSSFTVNETLANPGSAPLSGAALSLSAPSGWTVSPSGAVPVGTVQPRQSTAATFNVTPPASGSSTGLVSLVATVAYQAQDGTSQTITSTAQVQEPFPSGFHQLSLGYDGLCTDVQGNASTAGAAIDQSTCNGQTNQEFQFVPVSGGYGELQAENSGDDVAVSGSSTTAGSPVIQQVPNGNAASLWQPLAQSDGSWEFQNQNSGLCLDVFGAGSNVGQQYDQWQCKDAPGTNQDFTAG